MSEVKVASPHRSHPGYGEFRDGWPVVLASMLGVALSQTAIPFYTIGLFAPQLSQAFHWGFGQIQFGVLVASLTTLATVPVIGLIVDRFGVRVTALTSVVLFALSFMSFALSTASILQFYITWAIMGVVGTGTIPITWTRAVNNRFEERKGLALGLCLMGTGLFGMLGKPLVAWLIAVFGWRGGYLAVGLLPIVIALPVGLKYFHDGAERTDHAARKAADALRRASSEGLTLRQALADWRFWLIIVAVSGTAFAVSGTTPNMENILGSHGFSAAQIATMTPLIGASVIIGRLGSGWLMDRIWAPIVAFVILCLPAIALLLLTGRSVSYAEALASIGLIGVSLGMESDLVAFLVARYFGLRNYGSIYGLIYVFFALAGAVAASVFGWAYDQTRSYNGILTIGSIILVVGAGSFFTLGRYRFDEETR